MVHSMVRSIHPVIVGTAGHIDHGKSSLVRALTGVDPDRLKEEKERGLTIDLGFAPMQLSDGRLLGMVDVPGHERFVRNMVAGSSGMDLAILVVAADDGVMPQTREHLDIIHLLGVNRGIVALTKVDQVDADTAEMAADEVRELLQGSSLEGVEIMPLSSISGQGLPEFRQRLEQLAIQIQPRDSSGPFRMPIQRVFQLKGIGTVVTGIPTSGSIKTGEVVEFLPSHKTSKVRAIQAYGGDVEQAVAGHSTALSVPDIKSHQLRRGFMVTAPGVYRTGKIVDVEISMLAHATALQHRAPIRFHTGTMESKGLLLLLDRDSLTPGEPVVARVALEDPVCGVYGDRFLLRLQNPVQTVGGGKVLRLQDSHGKYRRRDLGDELGRLVKVGPSPESRVLEELHRAGPAGRSPEELAGALGVELSDIQEVLAKQDAVHIHSRGNRVFGQEVLADGEALLRRSVDKILKDKPLAASIKRTAIQTSKSLPSALLAAVFAKMQATGAVQSSAHGRVLFKSRLQPLAPADAALLEKIIKACESHGHRPEKIDELPVSLGISAKQFSSLLARGIDESKLETVGQYVYGAAVIRDTLVAIYNNCEAHAGELSIPELRDRLGTSRKFLIPLLEYVDSLGLTILRGGVRRLLPTSSACQEIADSMGAD